MGGEGGPPFKRPNECDRDMRVHLGKMKAEASRLLLELYNYR